MWIDWLDADNLSAYAAGLAGLEGSDARNGLASVSMGASGPDYGAGGREKTRPTRGHARHFREKTRPARHKTLILGHFARAGRIFSRYRQRQSALGELCRAHAAYRAAR